MQRAGIVVLAVLLAGPAVARAQPVPLEDDRPPSEARARALIEQAVRLIRQGRTAQADSDEQ